MTPLPFIRSISRIDPVTRIAVVELGRFDWAICLSPVQGNPPALLGHPARFPSEASAVRQWNKLLKQEIESD